MASGRQVRSFLALIDPEVSLFQTNLEPASFCSAPTAFLDDWVLFRDFPALDALRHVVT